MIVNVYYESLEYQVLTENAAYSVIYYLFFETIIFLTRLLLGYIVICMDP